MNPSELLIRPIKQQKLINLALRYYIAYIIGDKIQIAKIKEEIRGTK